MATRVPAPAPAPAPTQAEAQTAPQPPARILRHPQIRKGLVMMQLCEPQGTTSQLLVSKRQGDVYRAARHADWGDVWPPTAPPPPASPDQSRT